MTQFGVFKETPETELTASVECILPTAPPGECLVAPGTTAGVPTGFLPVPENAQLLGRVLGGRQHVQVALFLTQPAGVLAATKGQDSGCVNMHRLTWLLATHWLRSHSGSAVNMHL